MENNATIVTLSPAADSVEVVSFEQAFGEHSEFKGKGRARRQSRRQARKVKKLTDKSARKRIKQGIKNEAQESRQGRRDKSKSRRVSRKAMGQEEEVAPEMESETVEQEQQYVEPVVAQEEQYEEEYQPSEEEDQYQQEEDDDWSSSFDGENPSVKSIHPEIADLTKRIVWNKEKARQHDRHRARIHSAATELAKTSHNKRDLMEHRSAIEGHTMEMQKHEERAEDLKKHLAEKHGDHPHVAHGYKNAHALLQRGKEKKIDKAETAKVRETIVQEGLRPEFSKQRIDIPAGSQPKTVEIKSNASGIENVAKGMSTGTKWIIALGLIAGATYLAHKKGLIKF